MMKRMWMVVVTISLAVVFFPAISAVADLNLWISYHYAGEKAYETGNYADAEAQLVKAIELASGLTKEEKVVAALKEGEKAPDACEIQKKNFRLAETMNALGMVYTAREQFDKAEDQFKQAKALLEKEYGFNSCDVAKTLNNLADMRYVSGQKEGVEALYNDVLNRTRQDEYSVETSRALNGLALLRFDEGNFAEARTLLNRAVALHEKANRREHPYLATALINLAIVDIKQNQLQQADSVLKRAQFIQDTALPKIHPDVAIRLRAKAALLAKEGCADGAASCQQEVDEIQTTLKAQK